MRPVRDNINEQIKDLLERGATPLYISLNIEAYNYLKNECNGFIEEYNGLKLIVNPFQYSYVAVLSDCVTEAILYESDGYIQ